MHRKAFFLLIVAVVLLLNAGAGLAQGAAWTILVYMEADNNLEGDAIADLLEMELIGSTDAVNIVVQIDRAQGYSAADGDWTDARRYLVQRNPNIGSVTDLIVQKFENPDGMMLGSPVLEQLGEINNGDPQTLLDFILWGAQSYPAQKYGLIMWNHGGTWVGGFGGDESTENHDGINIPELDAALGLATEAIGQKFEFIGFDTCLMGQAEVFMILSKYANFAAGAEELEPGFGWFYTPVVETLVNNPGVNGGEVASVVVDAYMAFYGDLMPQLIGQPFWMNYDQTAVDLSKMAEVDAAIINFSTVAQANAVELLPAISDARNNTQFFGGATPDEADPLSSVDLVHFMELLMRLTGNAAVDEAAQQVITAVDNLVIVSGANEGLPGARGLSIFFPRNARVYTATGNSERYINEIGYMPAWRSFIDTFYGTASELAVEGSVSILNVFTTADVASILNPPTVLFETNGQNITSVSFSAILDLGDGAQIMLDQSELESLTFTEDGEPFVDFEDGVSQSQFTWAAEMPVVTDGTVSVPTLLLDVNDDELAGVSGIYAFQNGTTIDAVLTFSRETRQVVNIWGINQSENGGQPFEISPTAGDEFLPTWRFYDAEGNVQLSAANQVLTVGSQPFSFDFAPASSGNYTLYIVMEDATGSVYLDTAQITVNNEGLQPIYRGTNDLNYGYSFNYPWQWSEPYDVESEDGSTRTIATNLDGSLNIYFNFYEVDSLDTMLEVAGEYADSAGMSFTSDVTEIALGGYPAYIADYEMTTAEGEYRFGVVMVTYVEENATGYLIDFEAAETITEEEFSYLDVLIESLRFFPPIE